MSSARRPPSRLTRIVLGAAHTVRFVESLLGFTCTPHDCTQPAAVGNRELLQRVTCVTYASCLFCSPRAVVAHVALPFAAVYLRNHKKALMRASVAFGCLLGVLAVTVLPGVIEAQQTASIASSLDGGSTRGLLVVDNKPKPADQKTSSDSGTTAGTSSVSLGSDLFISDDRPQPAAKPAADTTAATKKPQQVRATKKGKKSAGLGRRGGQNFRQLANGTFPDDYILPGCRPGLGTICADNDNLGLLKALPAEIDLDNTYPFFELTPKGGFTVQSKDTADLGFDTFSSANTVEGTGGGGLTVGNEQLNADSDVTTTLATTTVDASRRDRIIPDSIKTTVDSTDATGTYTWNTLHPIYTYAIGQNWGLPNGLQTVTDGITGRKK